MRGVTLLREVRIIQWKPPIVQAATVIAHSLDTEPRRAELDVGATDVVRTEKLAFVLVISSVVQIHVCAGCPQVEIFWVRNFVECASEGRSSDTRRRRNVLEVQTRSKRPRDEVGLLDAPFDDHQEHIHEKERNEEEELPYQGLLVLHAFGRALHEGDGDAEIKLLLALPIRRSDDRLLSLVGVAELVLPLLGLRRRVTLPARIAFEKLHCECRRSRHHQ
mmetsp:Transcript_23824/g.73822  ORF Transcript_23824/g.73822 Transcript_23824/m.73822 type:complete len:220 (-) Transcript_23824:15-674(-)